MLWHGRAVKTSLYLEGMDCGRASRAAAPGGFNRVASMVTGVAFIVEERARGTHRTAYAVARTSFDNAQFSAQN